MKKLIINLAKKNRFFMILLRKARFAIGRIRYLFYYLTNKVDDNLIVFDAYMGRQYACSPKAIYEELKNSKKYKNFKFVWAFKNPNDYKRLKSKKTSLVKYGSKNYYKLMSQAKYWITNSRLNEVILKKRNQVYIQCWHGTPLKKLGYDITVSGGNAMNSVKDIRYKYKTDSKRYDYMISPSKFCTEKFASAFDIKNKEILIETGYPRNDFLINFKKTDVDRIKKELDIPKKKKVILYAPTWRDDQHSAGIGYTYQPSIDFDELKKQFGSEYVLLFRTHYFIANYIDLDKYNGFVYNVSQYDDINDLYVISDILITDYSSVFFDYANLKRPMIFYMYDYDAYKNKLRDFYIDLDELPGPIVRTEKELNEAIKNIDKKKYAKEYKKFNEKYNYLDDGFCAKRVIEKCVKKHENH